MDVLSHRGKRVVTLSTDDFFFDQDLAPKNGDGTPNYDAVEHTDLAGLTHCLKELNQGEAVSLPAFDFVSGKRKENASTLNGKDFDVFIVEGIHALNDLLLSPLSALSSVFFYLDVTKGVSLEDRVSFVPEEIRFFRRLIRDFKHRNASAPRTFSLWENVLEAEKEILHPYKRNADRILGTDFSYELAVVKEEATALLEQVNETSPFFGKASRLKLALSHFPSLSEQVVPTDSVLREFID
jgi:uridine kinase